ncbi:MAG: signal peptidase II [Lachnospiraceae bacterium]|nr:signal peptidase II [Lachnospiraceae bacterium]
MQSILLTAAILSGETVLKKHRENNKEEKEYLDGNVHIMTYHNYGAFLNSGDRKPILVKWISILLTLLMTALFILSFTKYGNKELRTGLAFLLGGAYSNTYDRIKKGFVTDYLNFPKLPGKIRNIVFNISDFCILIGCGLILIKQK